MAANPGSTWRAPGAAARAPAAKGSPRSLSGLLPFLRPYRGRIALALLFLVLARGHHAGVSAGAEVR